MNRWRWPAAGLLSAAAAASVQSRLLADEPSAPTYSAGAATFQANCVVCHGAKGQGQPGLAPPLTAYPARYITSAEGRRQLAMTVLYGMYGDIAVDGQHYDFRMPNFSRLDDAALATVLNYVAFDLAHAAADATAMQPEEIAAERPHAMSGDAVRQHRASLVTALGL